MKRPLVGVALVFAAGIAVAHWFPSWFTTFKLGLIALGWLVVFVFASRTRLSLAALMMATLVAGAQSYRFATTIVSASHLSRSNWKPVERIGLRGVIGSDPETTTPGTVSSRHRFVLAVEELDRGHGWHRAEGNVLLSVWRRTNEADRIAFRYGDRIECHGLIREVEPSTNPGAFDWENWLKQKQIAFMVTVGARESCVIVDRNQGNAWTALSLSLRKRFQGALTAGLETEPGLAGILAGMVVGERSAIPDDAHNDFKRTGVFHVFAVSGLHVMLVATAVVTVLWLLQMPRRWSGLVAIPLLALYVYATGARPGAVRAMWMCCVWLLGWSVLRPTDSLNSLGAAALVVLAFKPLELFNGGFILSFAVVGTLVVMTPRIYARLAPLIMPDPYLPASHVPRWRKWVATHGNWFLQLLSGSMAAFFGMLPLMAYYFHLLSPISIVANIVVVPTLQLIIALGLLSIALHGLWPLLAEIFNNANYLLLNFMIGAVDWFESWPGGYRYVRAPPVWLIAAYYGAGAVLLSDWFRKLWIRIPRRREASAVVLTIGVGTGVWLVGMPSETQITVLDLNRGMAVFLDAPGTGRDVLFDTGGDEATAQRVVIPFLRSRGVNHLGIVTLTSGLKAHAGGAEAVLREIPVREVVSSGIPSQSIYYKKWIALIESMTISNRTVRAGVRLSQSKHVVVDVLHPPVDSRFKRSSDNALVLAVTAGNTRVLMMSDAGQTVERLLLEKGAPLKADILIMGVNENEPSGTETFLDAVRPELVITAVSKRDNRRYPAPELRSRLEPRAIRHLRTDDEGAVIIRIGKDGRQVETIKSGVISPSSGRRSD